MSDCWQEAGTCSLSTQVPAAGKQRWRIGGTGPPVHHQRERGREKGSSHFPSWSRTSRPRTFVVRGATCLPEFLIPWLSAGSPRICVCINNKFPGETLRPLVPGPHCENAALRSASYCPLALLSYKLQKNEKQNKTKILEIDDFWKKRGFSLADEEMEVQRDETNNMLVVGAGFQSETSFKDFHFQSHALCPILYCHVGMLQQHTTEKQLIVLSGIIYYLLFESKK